MNLINHHCPLCGAPAVCYEADHGERHYYSCHSCSKFMITSTAGQWLDCTVHQGLAKQARRNERQR
ncbi:MAG: hypothetical protein QM777_20590 [Pseudorhodoferax sp.]